VGSFELLDGMTHLPAEVLIEVTAIDDVHHSAKQWLEQAAGPQETAKRNHERRPDDMEVASHSPLNQCPAFPSPSGNGKIRCAASLLPSKAISPLSACASPSWWPLECSHYRAPAAGCARWLLRSGAVREQNRDRARARCLGDSLRGAGARSQPAF